jgi:hypothetical protein
VKYLVADNADSRVGTGGAALGATSIPLATGSGVLFPAPAAGEAFIGRIGSDVFHEPFTCISRDGDTLLLAAPLTYGWPEFSTVKLPLCKTVFEALVQRDELSTAGGPGGYYADTTGQGNPHFAQCKALLHFEDGLIDTIPGNVWTAGAGVAIVNHDAKFGGHALACTGAGGVTTPNTAGKFCPGTGDWCFTGWFKPVLNREWQVPFMLGSDYTDSGGIALLVNYTGLVAPYIGGQDMGRMPHTWPSTYGYLEFSCTSGVYRVFAHGTLIASGASSAALNSTGDLYFSALNGIGGEFYYGLHAGHTENYTPPAAPEYDYASGFKTCSLQFNDDAHFNGSPNLCWDATNGRLLLSAPAILSTAASLTLPDGGVVTGTAAAVAAPVGGGTVDAEARASLSAVIAALQAAGLMKAA